MTQLDLSEQFSPTAEKEGDPKYVMPPSTSTSFPQVVYVLQGKGILINTQKVPANKEPKTWQDLVDPFWAGKSWLSTTLRAGPARGRHGPAGRWSSPTSGVPSWKVSPSGTPDT